MSTLKSIALALVIIGAINWGLIGLFQFDLVAAIFGGQNAGLARVIYTLVGVSGLISLAIYTDLMRTADVDDLSVEPRNLGYGTEFGQENDFSTRNNPSKDDRDI